MMSIDGTHCPIEEPRPFSTEWSSHKHGGNAGVNYELGVLLHKPRLAWCYGPTRPGKKNDLGVFQENLREALSDLSDDKDAPRRVIGDGIYSGDPDFVSTKNDFDPYEIAQFKNRALSRHEKYNGLLKNFKVLADRFRHQNDDIVAQHRMHFLAVNVLVQTQLDNGGYTLYDVYP